MKLEVITPNKLAKRASDAWESQYKNYTQADVADKQEIGRQLKALDAPTAARVNAIIGNESWTSVRCDGCGGEGVERAVVYPNPWWDDEGASTMQICEDCISDAARALRLLK